MNDHPKIAQQHIRKYVYTAESRQTCKQCKQSKNISNYAVLGTRYDQACNQCREAKYL